MVLKTNRAAITAKLAAKYADDVTSDLLKQYCGMAFLSVPIVNGGITVGCLLLFSVGWIEYTSVVTHPPFPISTRCGPAYCPMLRLKWQERTSLTTPGIQGLESEQSLLILE